MARRVYWESLKKWAREHKLLSGGTATLVGLLFAFLIANGDIFNVSKSGHSFCNATEWDFEAFERGDQVPCALFVNFTVNNTIFVYPLGYDPWGRNTPLNFNPAVKDWKMYRKWGNSWREYDLTKVCTSPTCGAKRKGLTVYSLAWRKGKSYEIRVLAIKNNTYDIINWSIGIHDPTWFGETVCDIRKIPVYPKANFTYTCPTKYFNISGPHAFCYDEPVFANGTITQGILFNNFYDEIDLEAGWMKWHGVRRIEADQILYDGDARC